jgi:2,4-dienoyl-CoA reductase-like NADH-dependent reductase (Old Yellow Enzyme family)
VPPATAADGGQTLQAFAMSPSHPTLSDPLSLAHGPALPNRLMLAPLTNMQSHADGTVSDNEAHWLLLRAQGGFGLTMTAAAHVQAGGQGFPGQLGSWSDAQLPGLARLAQGIRDAGSLSSLQLQHSGRRSDPTLTGQPKVSPWDDAETGARALSTAEVEQLAEDFILAALRAERAGFDGVEVHGAHGYLLCAFLDAEHNQRSDRYGGSFENRSRLLFEIIDGIRQRAGPGFQIGLRISPERYGIPLAEARGLAGQMLARGQLDYLDLSLWDVFKPPLAEGPSGRPLIAHFSDLPRGATRLGVAGKLMDAARSQACLDAGADFVLIGRGAILHHDFARRALLNPGFCALPRPVSRAHLQAEGVSPAFMAYLAGTWPNFVGE